MPCLVFGQWVFNGSNGYPYWAGQVDRYENIETKAIISSATFLIQWKLVEQPRGLTGTSRMIRAGEAGHTIISWMTRKDGKNLPCRWFMWDMIRRARALTGPAGIASSGTISSIRGAWIKALLFFTQSFITENNGVVVDSSEATNLSTIESGNTIKMAFWIFIWESGLVQKRCFITRATQITGSVSDLKVQPIILLA